MAAYRRADRVNALLQRELGMLISEELRDPRIAFATVTAVEVTDDLRSFWATTYPQVRKDLRARYPKHSWPEDPLSAKPEAKGGRRR